MLQVVLSWCPCHHTLPGEQRGQNVPRCFGAHRTAHTQLLSTKQRENPSETIHTAWLQCHTKQGTTLGTELEQPQAKYSPLFGLLKPPRRCCHRSSTTCHSPCSWHRQCLSGRNCSSAAGQGQQGVHTWDTGTPTTWSGRPGASFGIACPKPS